MPYQSKKVFDKVYSHDVVPPEELFHPNGSQHMTLYKGIVVQWDQMLLCNRKVFSIIDKMDWKMRIHLIRVFANSEKVYMLWKSYISFIPKGYVQGSIIDTECNQGEENELEGGFKRPGMYFFVVEESVVLHSERKV